MITEMLEMDTDEEEYIRAFLSASNMEHVLQKYRLIPVEEYGSEGLMPIKNKCPNASFTDEVSCVGSSGDNMCMHYHGAEGYVDNFIVKCGFTK